MREPDRGGESGLITSFRRVNDTHFGSVVGEGMGGIKCLSLAPSRRQTFASIRERKRDPDVRDISGHSLESAI